MILGRSFVLKEVCNIKVRVLLSICMYCDFLTSPSPNQAFGILVGIPQLVFIIVILNYFECHRFILNF